jgi:HSP20 family protein
MRQTLGRLQSYGPLWSQLHHMQNEVNGLFERWEGSNSLRAFAPAYPALNIWEESDSVWVEAELPGLTPGDLDIQVSGGDQLTLKGERKPQSVDNTKVLRQERGYGKFVRSLQLPFPVDADNVEARFDNGVLRIRLAKAKSAMPRKIAVKAE